nr:PREDICTED: C-type natriuretic peptide-like [Lepisosteus oculatus]
MTARTPRLSLPRPRYLLLGVLLACLSLVPTESRALKTAPAMQLLREFLEQYRDLLTADELESLAGDPGERLRPADTTSKAAEYPGWTDLPPTSEHPWYRLLRDTLANRKRAFSDRAKKGWARGCFGLKLDRIGSLSGLGC